MAPQGDPQNVVDTPSPAAHGGFLAAAGFALVALMQVVFVATAADRPFPYREVQVISVVASSVLVFGAWRGMDVALAAGFAVNALTRVAQIAFALSRLPLVLNAALAVGWIWAAVASARGRSARPALWLLAIAHALSMFWILGRFWAAVGLALGAAGLFLAAPNLRHRG